MGAYGSNDTANSANVNFNYGLALQAARDLYKLSGDVTSTASDRSGDANLARPQWQGPFRDDFDGKISVEGRDAGTVSSELVSLANQFAKSWSEARGEQDRINKARYVQHKEDSENWVEKGYHDIAGQTDYGPPPGNPPVPSPPGYEPTRAPMYPQYGP